MKTQTQIIDTAIWSWEKTRGGDSQACTFQGDHHVHVIKVFKDHLQLDRWFDVDFNTAFPTGASSRL